jgi:hypothetical protein
MKLLLSLVVMTAGMARADIIYTLTGLTAVANPPQRIQTFTYVSPDYILTDRNVSAAELLSCTNCNPGLTTTISFTPITSFGVLGASTIRFFDVNNAEYLYPFLRGAFSADGVYGALGAGGKVSPDALNTGTLTVQSPEPSTIALIVSSVLALTLLSRRRNARGRKTRNWRTRKFCRPLPSVR